MIRASLAMVAVLALLPGACDIRRGEVAPGPGETPAELDAASRALTAVVGSTPLIEVHLRAAGGGAERRTVGAVVGEHRRIIVDASVISLLVGDGENAGTAHTRTIEAIFHPGADGERRATATVLRESAEQGLALLSVDAGDEAALPFSDDLPDGTDVFLLAAPLNMTRLVVEAGSVSEYAAGAEGRSIAHTAGQDDSSTGPLVDAEGELVGLQVDRGDGTRWTLPAVEIARWLQRPGDDEAPPAEPGQVVERMLRQMAVDFRTTGPSGGFVVPQSDGTDVLVRQTENVITVQVNLGTLHAGDAVEAVRAGYPDPVGALALRPTNGGEQLTWVARLSATDATAGYLSYIVAMASAQSGRWSQLQSGLEPDFPYDLYPGGDEAAQNTRLLEIIEATSLAHESSGEGWKLEPESAVPVYVTVFRGMAYVYAYSGGLPGEGESEQDQVARELLRRNWELPLGRLALDKYLDLAWEAQVPMDYLTSRQMAALNRAGAAEVTALKSKYGEISFNEQ